MPRTKTNVVTISRDPFARMELIRKIDPNHRTCANCGEKRYFKGKEQVGMFVYGVESDGGTKYWERKGFCGRSCRTEFNS